MHFFLGALRVKTFMLVSIYVEIFRRRKARERQQKLMADFASKQKAFMEQAMETDGKTITRLYTLPQPG